MKFSDIKKDEWLQLRPYLDTCLVPYTGLRGSEEPWEVAERLERLRDIMDLVEQPYKGRVVTYPAVQYAIAGDENTSKLLASIARNMKASVFKFVVLVSTDPLDPETVPAEIDLVITNEMKSPDVQDKILALWGK